KSRRSFRTTSPAPGAPLAPVFFKQVVGALGAPGAGEVVRKDLRLFGGPGLQDRRIERPCSLDAIAMRKERLIAEHGIEQQPLVAVGPRLAEGRLVIEVHVDGADIHLRCGRHLRSKAQGDAEIRLKANTAQGWRNRMT